MDARNVIKLGMSAERTLKVTPDLRQAYHPDHAGGVSRPR